MPKNSYAVGIAVHGEPSRGTFTPELFLLLDFQPLEKPEKISANHPLITLNV